MTRLRHHASIERDKTRALHAFHSEVLKRTETLIGHTFFEIVCPAPVILEVPDIERYATQWVDKGWSADVVATNYENGKSALSLRLRSYIDSFPF